MGQIDVNGSSVGGALTELLVAPDIEPGDPPSYQVCKAIYLYHPLGKKMAEWPIAMAQSQAREISVPQSPEEKVRDKFVEEWKTLGCDDIIRNTMTLARVYGLASLATVSKDVEPGKPIDSKKYASISLSFSVFDPLNTAGSLVLNQDPNSIDFMKWTTIAVSGVPYHRSRAVVVMNERPVYIAYTTSAFGFVGRSVYQRGLFMLKSFIQTMITDDLITKKAGVFIVKLSVAGAIIDNIMQMSAGLKRIFVRIATTGNVISIGKDEEVQTLDFQNLDGAYGMARENILENLATSADMPAIILKQETFAEGFGEGTEDSRMVASYIDDIRKQMNPLYAFLDPIVQRRAWNEDFFAQIQNEYPDYKKMSYEQAFLQWQNSFAAVWPSYLKEPDSEQVKTDDVKLKAVIAILEVLAPMLPPEEKATLIQWVQDNFNANKRMFTSPLLLAIEAIAAYRPAQPPLAPGEPKPFAATDAVPTSRKAMENYDAAVAGLVATLEHREERGRRHRPNGDAR